MGGYRKWKPGMRFIGLSGRDRVKPGADIYSRASKVEFLGWRMVVRALIKKTDAGWEADTWFNYRGQDYAGSSTFHDAEGAARYINEGNDDVLTGIMEDEKAESLIMGQWSDALDAEAPLAE